MICAAIKGATIQEMVEQVSQAERHADLIEIRLDSLNYLDLDEVQTLLAKCHVPVIFTLRSQAQGGSYRGAEALRLDMVRCLAALNPAYLDLEWDVPAGFLSALASQYPDIKLIISYHDFDKTPDDLDTVLEGMKSNHAYWYKIAVMANSCLDMLRLMDWVQNKQNIIAVSMGAAGQPGRLIGPVVGCPLTFGCLDVLHETAPGQLPISVLNERYGARRLDTRTVLYGLIGDPVDKSISDHTHNYLVKELGINAVYVKIQVKPEELGEFIQYARRLPFRGLSVTMPHKECVMKYLDGIDPTAKTIGAVNTLKLSGGTIAGYNTDAMGALNALEDIEPVTGKRVLILGAGGAAKAIAYEACRRGADVRIVNRDADRARRLADQLGCEGGGLQQIHVGAETRYRVLINTTPVEMPIDEADIVPGSIVMDIKTRPQTTELLRYAQKQGCAVVYGYRMFVEQAVGQYALWFDGALDTSMCQRILDEQALHILSAD